MMRKKYLLIFLVLLCDDVVLAQNGRISGRILNEKNESLQGVSIKIVGAPGGTTSNIEGRFVLSLASDKTYEIAFSAIGYAAKNIDNIVITSGEVTELDITLENAGKKLDNVTVTATRTSAKRETINALLQFQKNTNTVAAVVSAEAIRRSPDKNTSEVLKRIPGTSIQEGKYIIVRGLSDRYNMAMLNGIPLSSTEPDRKNFAFDIFPAPMIDNIIINKAFVPEYPGEWAGGLIQVNTKDIPSANFMSVQVGTGFNTQTVGNEFFTYKGGRYDWAGIDDGSRDLPSGFPTKSAFNHLSNEQKTALG
ncbi:MAG: carboxypeptidase-like regulatory domain-containing protein, partial [Ginsengibacter sp.]